MKKNIPSCDKIIVREMVGVPPSFTRQDMLDALPGITDVVKCHSLSDRSRLTNKNLRSEMYKLVIERLYSEDTFSHAEDKGDRIGLYVKGYTQDVLDYLRDAYELIHNEDLSRLIRGKKQCS
jgi:hypothetical protein